MWENVAVGAVLVGAVLAVAWTVYALEKEHREKREAMKGMKVVYLEKKGLENVKDHVKYLPGVGPALVMSEEERKEHGLTPEKKD